MARTKRAVVVWLLVVAAIAAAATSLITDPTGSHLELAPVFVGTALAVVGVRVFRSRSGRPRS